MDWFLRVFKGMLIGSGFILPGISGGTLAVVFGVYERVITFLANIRKNFKQNVLFFLPLGIGGILGIVVFSLLMSVALAKYEYQMLWVFIGAIVGTLPTLFRQSTEQTKRTTADTIILITTALIMTVFLIFGQGLFSQIPQNFFTWILSGFLIGLGVIIPGLSPSNFLIYMGMYQPMTDGLKTFDLGIVIPLAIGGILSLVTLSKLVNLILQNYHSRLFNFIIGVVIASTIVIIPLNVTYDVVTIISCAGLFLVGIGIAYLMTKLDQKEKA
ncbi:DUF368 domain-containing protein [Holzapfeliella floricola]|uniref:Putative integral membrane protein n=1 Tax=Holzapfeliella floricola DSM 23037 = JCM 16512 TaxID=1423744 RepID=A0A0R2DS73_9LACO|nr:DUF368 domain-containing protein [Holzapfeliella floricola]KRN04661.1 putative integral membrane protein [Holzapfeliella floricola DSM 23037 = JCM 16512]